MDAQLEIELIECLDALAQGESMERILARYPQDAVQLRPLLQTAADLPALRMEPSEAMKLRSRQKFMAQADQLRRPAARKRMGFLPRFATGFVAAGLIAVVLSTGAVAASDSALPGDPLYGVKRTVETVRLDTAASPVVRDELQREFDQRRRDEANGLLDAGRASEVEFTGTIESIQPGAWIVGGLAIEVSPATTIVGTPQLNQLAEVKGATGPNGLRASSITIESAGENEATPEAESTATPETEDATETPQPEKTQTPTEVEKPIGTLPTPTVAPRPLPTATTQPVEVEFTGSAQAIDASTWSIDGTIIVVNADTQIHGTISPGRRVKVKALRLGNGQLVALSIEPIEDGGHTSDNSSTSSSNQNDAATPVSGGNHNDNHNGNQNENTNTNTNSNTNENGNSNENTNSNSNENENRNTNTNSNSNDNSNENGTNSNDH